MVTRTVTKRTAIGEPTDTQRTVNGLRADTKRLQTEDGPSPNGK